MMMIGYPLAGDPFRLCLRRRRTNTKVEGRSQCGAWRLSLPPDNPGHAEGGCSVPYNHTQVGARPKADP
jgi:hypothetical protein